MDAYVGEIRAFAGNYAPVSWALCDGSLIAVANNQQLFSLIGTTYGGNGVTTFGLPDLRGRLIVGVGKGAGIQNNYVLGAKGGVEGVTLTEANLPAHQHSFMVSTNNGTSNAPSGAVVIGAPIESNQALGKTVVEYLPDSTANPGQVLVPLNQATLSSAGSNTVIPHENRMPFVSISYIICTTGYYPEFQ